MRKLKRLFSLDLIEVASFLAELILLFGCLGFCGILTLILGVPFGTNVAILALVIVVHHAVGKATDQLRAEEEQKATLSEED